MKNIVRAIVNLILPVSSENDDCTTTAVFHVKFAVRTGQ